MKYVSQPKKRATVFENDIVISSDRLGNDGFLGVLDPGSSIPGSRYLGKHLSTFIEVLQLGQVDTVRFLII